MRRTLEEEAAKYDLLGDPQRRRIYLAMRQASKAMSKDEVAASLGISRTLATFHLEKLLEGGFLEAHFARSTTQQTLRSGRPAKYYRPTDREVALRIPPRRYDVAAEILASALSTTAGAVSPTDRALELARAKGREAGEQFEAEDAGRRRGTTRGEVMRLLDELGYEPRLVGTEILLRNCPFDHLVFPPYLICEINLQLLQGALEGCRARRLEAVEDHREGHCCVVLNRTKS
ncbi:MAG: transcriptional regulator [Actinobacteria bacterium]|nr:transcriptional regulator [Actinomycetota bacterium]MBW3651723.1 transcriptional regulator [Actinomycetota bacterium]